MRKILLILLLAANTGLSATAAVGDTTWVQAHNDIQMDHFGDFDNGVQFPDGSVSYRKIYMIFTLGKYACPGSPQYCSDWDYTVQNFLMTPAGDTLELGRLITPYAKSARMNASWKEQYIYDVTDFYPVLKNQADMRVHYSGYSWGFTANVKFAFIEGTPPRNVIAVQRVIKGSHGFGKPGDPIDDHIQPVSLTAPAGTQSAELKFNITGHGADDNLCSEFCKKYYNVMLNGNSIAQKDIWRDNCGSNWIYPQNGTWIYDRGNWCPGDLIHTNSHVLTGITDGNQYTVDVDFEAYTGSTNQPNTSWGSYITEGTVIYYAGFNRTLDASLEDIVAPSNYGFHFRQNPATPKPIIRVKNTGSTAITSLKIEYGLPGKHNPTYTWQGMLNALETTDITLPDLWELRVETGTDLTFNAKILEVNGQGDADGSNNNLSSVFNPAPQWPDKIQIRFFTNNSVSGGVAETSYKIIDAGENVVFERSNSQPATLHLDTVQLGPGYYRLVVEDKGCDGLSWWANSAGGSGYIQVRKLGSTAQLPLAGNFSGDFGCGFTQQFNVNWPTGVSELTTNMNAGIDVFPNPAVNTVTVSITGINNVNGKIQVTDAIGRIAAQQPCNSATATVNLSSLANGVYSIIYHDAVTGNKLQTKLVITK